MDRADLHKLVNKIPESEIPTAQAFLDFLILRSSSGVDAVEKAFDEAPDDDEDYPEELLASIEQAREEAQRGETISHQEMKRRYGIA